MGLSSPAASGRGPARATSPCSALRGTAVEAPDGERPWAAFRLSGDEPARSRLLVAPTIDDLLDGELIEDVLFMRDEMAAMGWGIERLVEGPLGLGIDGYGAYRARLAANPPPAPRTRGPDDPTVEYVLGTDVPDNWIPMVHVRSPGQGLRFRRGILGGPGAREPRRRILEPGRPFRVADEAIPREGVSVTRRWRRARWIDGSKHLWIAREARIGRGPGASGLAFDIVRDVPPRAATPPG